MAMPSQTITFRLPSTFAKEVEQQAKAAQMTPGTWVRELVLTTLNERMTDSASERVEPTAATRPMADDTLGRVKEVLDDCLKAFFRDRQASSDEVSDESREMLHQSLTIVSRIDSIDQSLQRIGQSLATFAAQVGSLTDLPPKVEATIGSLNSVHRKLDKHHALSMEVSDSFHISDCAHWNMLLALERDLAELRQHLSLSVMALLTESGKMTADEANEWVGKFLTHPE